MRDCRSNRSLLLLSMWVDRLFEKRCGRLSPKGWWSLQGEQLEEPLSGTQLDDALGRPIEIGIGYLVGAEAISVAELLEARALLEVPAAQLAAERGGGS